MLFALTHFRDVILKEVLDIFDFSLAPGCTLSLLRNHIYWLYVAIARRNRSFYCLERGSLRGNWPLCCPRQAQMMLDRAEVFVALNTSTVGWIYALPCLPYDVDFMDNSCAWLGPIINDRLITAIHRVSAFHDSHSNPAGFAERNEEMGGKKTTFILTKVTDERNCNFRYLAHLCWML